MGCLPVRVCEGRGGGFPGREGRVAFLKQGRGEMIFD